MDLEFDEVASGPCIVCGKESEGSAYWLPMSEAQWEVIRPFVKDMTPISPHSGVKLVLSMLFWPQLCKPLCGVLCAYKRKRKNDGKAA